MRVVNVDKWEMFTAGGLPVYTNGRFVYEIGKSNKCSIPVTSLGESKDSRSQYSARVEKKLGVPVEWRFAGKEEVIFL